MAAAEHAITISDESVPMELPSLPPNQGVEAMKDIIFGSVSGAWRIPWLRMQEADPDSTPGGRNGWKTHRVSLRHG